MGRYQAALANNGVDLVQITHPHAGKNGADIRMTVEAMETLFSGSIAAVHAPACTPAVG